MAMQLVRVLTGRFERSWRRKIDEMVLAVLLTRHVPSNELPALYLSVGYYGFRRVVSAIVRGLRTVA